MPDGTSEDIMPRAVAVLFLAGLLLCACDPIAQVAVTNTMDDTIFVRLHPGKGFKPKPGAATRVAAHETRTVYGVLGDGSMTVEARTYPGDLIFCAVTADYVATDAPVEIIPGRFDCPDPK
jgi:hypothetical protein